MAEPKPTTKIRTVPALNRAAQELLGLEQQIRSAEEEFAAASAELASKHSSKVDPLATKRDRLRSEIEEFCKLRWDEITNSDAPDTAFLRTAVIERRFNPPSIGKLTADRAREIIAKLKTIRGGRKFIRTKEEVDSKELIANPAMAAKAGVEIKHERRFDIKPIPTQVSPVRMAKR